MYKAFQNTNPLPKDPSLIDYGFNIENEGTLMEEKQIKMCGSSGGVRKEVEGRLAL